MLNAKQFALKHFGIGSRGGGTGGGGGEIGLGRSRMMVGRQLWKAALDR